MVDFDIIIPAAGVGKRMQSSIPKQYLEIFGKTILEITTKKMLQVLGVKNVIVVINKEDTYFKSKCSSLLPNVKVVYGGAERSDSVLNGLNFSTSEYVLVHDAARPCVLLKDINLLIKECSQENGAILVASIPDTVKKSTNGIDIEETVPRTHLYRALTPQMFKRELLINAYNRATNNKLLVTDEASAMEMMGYKPKMVIGSKTNIKITEPIDLKIAEYFLGMEDSL
ncbi:MAG: 2-C-methyl-D-erythritol 4-phosphate cytidylyltransferase [Succinivibrionaceae bacterium]